MTQSLQIGPVALALPLLLAGLAWLLASLIGSRVAGANAALFDRRLLVTLLVGLFAARLAFVLQFRDIYLATPLDILDIRDGGWHAPIGIGAALAHVAVVLRRNRALLRPFAAALGVGAAVWFGGTSLLAMHDASEVRLPALTLRSPTGDSVSLASFHGRATVVNLWATWCPPCRREMPVLQAAQSARPEIHFVFLNQRESSQQVASYLSDSGLELRNVLLDRDGEAGTALGHRLLPTTLFFDAEGRLVDTRLGELSAATLAHHLERLDR